MKQCDLILKGGVTSGVVFPNAITEIAAGHRLRSIGGTSAGAIGAVLAAAAEHRRQTQTTFEGFEEINQIGVKLGEDMGGMFQPTPELEPLFSLGLAAMNGRIKALGALIAPRKFLALFCALLGGGAFIMFAIQGQYALGFLAVLFMIILLLVFVVAYWKQAIFTTLPAHNFGVCSGLTTKTNGELGITDWMDKHIESIAGNSKTAIPLTIGQLQKSGIHLAAMTTDLSSGRPYRLPFKGGIHLFSPAEFRKILPKHVVDYMVGVSEPLDYEGENIPSDLHWLPIGGDFPVLLLARMSLSFPGLFMAVPLYRHDDTLPKLKSGHERIRRCLFSDGGLTSNFPIHFFDSLLPSRPTFGISLEDHNEERHGKDRVFLSAKARQSTDMIVQDIIGLFGFGWRIFATAKDWKDTLQSRLPGYADRIVSIRLTKEEGGLNLEMHPDMIGKLGEYGKEAGEMLVNKFDFDQHRYRRAISVLPKLSEALKTLAVKYDEDYAELLVNLEVPDCENSKEWRSKVLRGFADELATLGQKQTGAELGFEDGTLPSLEASIRLVAEATSEKRDSDIKSEVGRPKFG